MNAITPGLLVLHGNRLEDLRQVVFDWTRQHPQEPLEEAIFLVQSNGIAEWLKMALAQDGGICAATRVELPAQCLWRCYRQMLGRAAVPANLPFDKAPLSWRLMRLLPELIQQDVFSPLRHFLQDQDPLRSYQLATRLADLFDQYQVYRADWLEDWAAGADVLRNAQGQCVALSPDQRWQAALWRAVLADVPEMQQQSSRAQIHRRFVAAIESGLAPMASLPRRVVLFGVSALPLQTLEALAALARDCQVIIAIPNPCRFYWGDIISGRELLRAVRKRHAERGNQNQASVSLEAMHAYSHPLLAAWGRMGRDFIRLLDEFDDATATRERFDIARIDVFDESVPESLLQQVQARIRDLAPLDPTERPLIRKADQSIVFRLAHSSLREVEILHDHLLSLLANTALAPREIIVMVPDIEFFAPSIRAVFAQYPANHARYIPFSIADQHNRGVNPLLVALEWLLDLPQQRCYASELRDLLDVPALARRFGLAEGDLEKLSRWMEGSGVRWGLSAQHREALGLAACGEQNSCQFGLDRMLLGYANGHAGSYAGIEPFDEIGGLEASLAGSFAALLDRLQSWRMILAQDAVPEVWGERFGQLLEDFFRPADERDRLTVVALAEALQRWLAACSDAKLQSPLSLAVAADAWLNTLDEPDLRQRFLGGGVTFCTLMPMRAIPFPVVCLLGMNEADYPRRQSRADFDLLALPGQARPGDRSRRDDDRYLMLEALLAARQQLYISWAGRNARDNGEEPPSILVSQLRDYLAAGWADGVLADRTMQHPLQPFSRKYFESEGLLSWAAEWRSAHHALADWVKTDLAPFVPAEDFSLNLLLLTDFLRSPVKHFFRYRLDVIFDQNEESRQDEEPFALQALEEYQLVQDFLAALIQNPADSLTEQITTHAQSLARRGHFPLAGLGEREQQRLVEMVTPMWMQWEKIRAQWPSPASKQAIRCSHAGVMLNDWLDHLRSDGSERAWIRLLPGKLCNARGEPVASKLFEAWLIQLFAASVGMSLTGIMVGRDAILTLGQPDFHLAGTMLADLMQAWRDNMDSPLPLASKTALAFLEKESSAALVYEGNYHAGEMDYDPCLARLFPDYAALRADGRFANWVPRLYGPLHEWAQTIKVEIFDTQIEDDEEVDHESDA